MTTKHIIFVPGKNPKPEQAQHRALLWRTLVVRSAEGLNCHRSYGYLVNPAVGSIHCRLVEVPLTAYR